MQEALLQYIWKHSLFEKKDYNANTGELITIENVGMHNTDEGPDFTNAKICIDGTVWAGNIEIHINSSDWNNHRHNQNPVYDNVILHVSNKTDAECITSKGRRVPCIEIQYDPLIEKNYLQLINEEKAIACYRSLHKLDTSLISFWLSALTVERLLDKTKYINELLSFTNNNWEEKFYIHLARSFGFKTNSLPFEMLAKHTPLKILAKHSSNLFQLEAILFGQAGFLDENPVDEYQSLLKKEYQYLKSKYQLKNIDVHIWKFLRLRPVNFPTIRIAELCSLINHSKSLLSKIYECEKLENLQYLLKGEVSEYWKRHYSFGKESKIKDKALGIGSINNFIINTIVPVMFVYAEQKNNEDLKEKSLYLLEQLPAEKNHIINEWNELGIIVKNAAESQALLQLSTLYCKPKRCLECQIGTLILNKRKLQSSCLR